MLKETLRGPRLELDLHIRTRSVLELDRLELDLLKLDLY
jgi:hypothetical protein